MAFEAAGGSATRVLASVAGGGWVLRIAPMMKKQVPIPMALMNSEAFRPSHSTPKKMKSEVATTFTTPKG